MLKAVNEIDCVHGHLAEALNDEAAAPKAVATPGLYIKPHDPLTTDVTHTASPTLSSSDLVGSAVVGIGAQRLDIDIPNEHPLHQTSLPKG